MNYLQMKIDKHIPENLKKISSDVDAQKQWHEEVTPRKASAPFRMNIT